MRKSLLLIAMTLGVLAFTGAIYLASLTPSANGGIKHPVTLESSDTKGLIDHQGGGY